MADGPRKLFDDMASVAGGAFSVFAGMRDEAQAWGKSAVEEAMRKFDLVRRAELDAVEEMAARARAANEAAEARIAALEARLAMLEGSAAQTVPPSAAGPSVDPGHATQVDARPDLPQN